MYLKNKRAVPQQKRKSSRQVAQHFRNTERINRFQIMSNNILSEVCDYDI
jgi:hypothetical protein